MRLDQKYFNLFIGICALLTLLVIIYGTINYTQKQKSEFRESIAEVQIDTLSFELFSDVEELRMRELQGSPVIIHFWTTWSNRSIKVNKFLDQYMQNNPDLVVIAAIVRDGDEQVQEYLDNHSHNFVYTRGTTFFQELLVPGVPSQILIGRDGKLFDTQVGDDTESLKLLLDRLLQDG